MISFEISRTGARERAPVPVIPLLSPVPVVGAGRFPPVSFSSLPLRMTWIVTLSVGLIRATWFIDLRPSPAGSPSMLRITSPNCRPAFCAGPSRKIPATTMPGRPGQAERFGQFLGQRLYFDAQPATNHLAVLDDRLHHFHRQFHRDRKTDALGAAGLGEDRRVDAGQVAIGIHQRAAGVARVDRRVGLDEVFVAVEAQLVTPGGADDAHGHGLADAERVADGQRDITDADAFGAADGDRRQVLQVDLQHRKVGFRVAADHSGQWFRGRP